MWWEIVLLSENGVTVKNQTRETLGNAADQAAFQGVFSEYRKGKAANTIRRQDADLSFFAMNLEALHERAAIDFTVGTLPQIRKPGAVSLELATGFLHWQLGKG